MSDKVNDGSEIAAEHAAQKVLLSALDNYGGHPFEELFDVVFPAYGAPDVRSCFELTKNCVVVIWGGADISPSILSRRDALEVEIANEAIKLGIPIIGICRGAQLMCAKSGASLVQHVNGHANGYHGIVTHDGRKFNCPSLHHQMMFPWTRGDLPQIDYELIAWSDKQRSDFYYGEPDEADDAVLLDPPLEPEIIWFPGTKSLCIQSHPEFIQSKEHPFVAYCLELVKKYVLV
jgi:hypothetical protein